MTSEHDSDERGFESTKLVKIVIGVPLSHVDKVRTAMAEAGSGQIGNYSHCSFTVSGKGRFLPNEEASPHIGESGSLETVDEERIEVVCSILLARTVITAARNAHPYEEMAVDVYPLLQIEDLP